MTEHDESELHEIRKTQQEHEDFLRSAFGYGSPDDGHFGREIAHIKKKVDVIDKIFNGNGRRGVSEKVAIMWASYVPIVALFGMVAGYVLKALIE